MKIFIAGARSITIIDNFVISKLRSICDKHFDVLVGDCYGVDTMVQSFLSERSYPNVTVYASNGKARNNVGKWPVKNVPVAPTSHGFEFFRQKDIAMANDADIGFMIWDGKSRGTLQNILTLAEQGKTVLVYLQKDMLRMTIHSPADAQKLIPMCDKDAGRVIQTKVAAIVEQISMF